MTIFKLRLLPSGPCHYPELTMTDEYFIYGPEVLTTIPGLGLRVFVPPDMYMVTVLSDGKRLVLDEGYQYRPEIPAGRYQVYFVAKRQGNLLLSIDTVSADAVAMKIDVTLGWKIGDPSLVTRSSSPLQQFMELCEAIFSEVFNRHKYEEIFGTFENAKPNLRAISQEIWRQVASLQHQCGISATNLKIRTVRGDSALSDQANNYLKAKFNQRMVEVAGETRSSEESYAALVTGIHQKALALEDVRNNLAQEPQRLQERILTAMQEIGRIITTQANIDGSSVPGFQQYYYKMDPAYGKAMEVAVTALRDLASSSTLPTEMQKLMAPLMQQVQEVSSGSNGHKGIQAVSYLPAKPPKDHARQKITNEPLAG